MKRNLIAIFIIAVLIGFSCSAKPVKLSEKDNGKTITVKKGAVLSITLSSNPTTGYEWSIKEMPENILQGGVEEYVQDKSEKGMVGTGGKEIFKFTAQKKGSGTLTLVYERKWEGELPDSKKFSIKINVQ
jgi:inhibitor of cysteine peptidase